MNISTHDRERQTFGQALDLKDGKPLPSMLGEHQRANEHPLPPLPTEHLEKYHSMDRQYERPRDFQDRGVQTGKSGLTRELRAEDRPLPALPTEHTEEFTSERRVLDRPHLDRDTWDRRGDERMERPLAREHPEKEKILEKPPTFEHPYLQADFSDKRPASSEISREHRERRDSDQGRERRDSKDKQRQKRASLSNKDKGDRQYKHNDDREKLEANRREMVKHDLERDKNDRERLERGDRDRGLLDRIRDKDDDISSSSSSSSSESENREGFDREQRLQSKREAERRDIEKDRREFDKERHVVGKRETGHVIDKDRRDVRDIDRDRRDVVVDRDRRDVHIIDKDRRDVRDIDRDRRDVVIDRDRRDVVVDRDRRDVVVDKDRRDVHVIDRDRRDVRDIDREGFDRGQRIQSKHEAERRDIDKERREASHIVRDRKDSRESDRDRYMEKRESERINMGRERGHLDRRESEKLDDQRTVIRPTTGGRRSEEKRNSGEKRRKSMDRQNVQPVELGRPDPRLGEQIPEKAEAAKLVLKKTDEGIPTTDGINEGLTQVETRLKEEAHRVHRYDRKTAKAVNDMANLVGAIADTVVETNLGDRLVNIAKEGKLAAREQALGKRVKDSLPGTARPTQLWEENILPLLRILISSKKFRRLIVDLVKITRKIFLRTMTPPESTEPNDANRKLKEQWLSGTNAKDIARDIKSTVNTNWKDEKGNIKVPVHDEEINVLTDDLIDLIALIASDERFHKGASGIFELGQSMYRQTRSMTEELKDMPHTKRQRQQTKELVAEFTGKKALDRFVRSVEILARRIRQDKEMSNYLDNFSRFILEKHPHAEHSEEFRMKIRDLIDDGRRIIDKWNNKSEMEDFLDAADNLLENVKNDELVQMLRDRAGILIDDFYYTDADGNRRLDTELVANMQKALIPVLADALKYIPIPTIRVSNTKMDLEVSDLVICGYDIIPENISLRMESESHFHIQELETTNSRTKLVLTLSNIRSQVKDVHFYFKRKTFPAIHDEGRVTISLTGRGATLTSSFIINQGENDKGPVFRSAEVDFDIDGLHIDWDKASIHHDVLLPMATTLFKGQVVRMIERGVEEKLRAVMTSVGRQMSESVSPKFSTTMDRVRNSLVTADTHKVIRSRHEMLKQ